jgi:ubiquinone/menaquinone biosynthesis C-methylase UbiE
MQDEAYDGMLALQENHWWWRGMRRLYQMTLRTFGQRGRVLEIGCGSGANLTVLQKEAGTTIGVDVSLHALQSIPRHPDIFLVQAEADALPFRAGAFDTVALLAVVEHVDRDDEVLKEAHRVTKRGGLQLLLTSAFMMLWSHHDVANNHRRRYLLNQMRQLQQGAGWQLLHASYLIAFLFPAVALVRTLQKRSKPPETAQYDMGPQLGPLNRVLEWLLGIEAWLVIKKGFRMPFGVDLFCVARRND